MAEMRQPVQASLFGEDFDVKITLPAPIPVRDLMRRIDIAETTAEISDRDTQKILKSSKISLRERLDVIYTRVLQVLGKQRHNTRVIRTKEDLVAYIDRAIANDRISIDTETNNSLDPITCKLMGPCLYTPGEKQAYIPINHLDLNTNELLPNQLTEEDCREQFQRLVDHKVFIVMHNGKFDYKVIKCTCGIEIVPDWDTMIAAKVLDENEFRANLKLQYIDKIDPTQEKYDIEELFENVPYAYVDPDIFALYAATDSMMTDKLYLWQKERMDAAVVENPEKNIYKLFKDVEMPCVQVVAEMELAGVGFDTAYANRLKSKYESQLWEIDNQIEAEFKKLEDAITAWKKTDEATQPARFYVAEKSKMSAEKIEANYPYLDTELNRRYKIGKSKLEQLEDPINLASPVQLAIFFYDILKLHNNAGDRSTGEDALIELGKHCPIAKLLLDRRGVVKLLDAFINSLPEKINSKTGKIHGSFHQYGAATGRFSSSEPNLQQIPSHSKNIRLLFTADTDYHQVDPVNNDCYEVPIGDEVETTNGWKKALEVRTGDTLIGEDAKFIVRATQRQDDLVKLFVLNQLN